MARRNLEVVVTVRDAASAGLDKIQKKVKDTGKAADQASIDFSKFNKTLFTTTAFMGTFIKGFSTIANSLDQGAELDRLSNQYERVLGPKGKLFDAIDNLTTTTIDKMTVLQEGLKLANLGIVKDSGQVADIFSKAGTAAKMAGMDSGEGVKRFTDFLSSGSVGQLEFLGLISRTNPALQAQMAILHKTGGVMGGVISTQARLAMGLNVLNSATEGQLKQQRDLADVMGLAKFNFTYLRGELGRFLGTALGPLIDSFSKFMYSIASTIDYIRSHSKELVFLTKAAVTTAGAITSLAGALGSVRLMVKLLSFAGIGLPGLVMSLITLGSVFLGITAPIDGVMKKFELFGGVVKGIWELVTNLDPETGLSKMSKGTYDMLKKAGLLEFVKMISRIISVTSAVISDIYKSTKIVFDYMDNMIGGFFNHIFKYFSDWNNTWTTWWTSDAISDVDKFTRFALTAASLIIAAFSFKKLFNFSSGLLTKIPVIGKLFGGGGKSPSGTADDPIYTKNSSGGPGDKPVISWLESFVKNQLLNLGIILKSTIPELLIMLGPIVGTAITAGFTGFAAIAGWEIGKVINTILDASSNTKNSDGFEGNWLERKMFDYGKENGSPIVEEYLKNTKSFNDLMNKSEVAPNNKISPISIPNRSEADNTMETIDKVGETMKGLSGAALERQRSAIEDSLSNISEGGKLLTQDEMNKIMNPGIEYLKGIFESVSKPNNNFSPFRQSPRN